MVLLVVGRPTGEAVPAHLHELQRRRVRRRRPDGLRPPARADRLPDRRGRDVRVQRAGCEGRPSCVEDRRRRPAMERVDEQDEDHDPGGQHEQNRRDAARLLHSEACRRRLPGAAMSRGESLRTRHGFVRSRLLEPPQLDAPDLPAPRLRQLVHELDLARVLVRRGHALAVLLQLPDELL